MSQKLLSPGARFVILNAPNSISARLCPRPAQRAYSAPQVDVGKVIGKGMEAKGKRRGRKNVRERGRTR